MPEKDRPLPEPPERPFGRKKGPGGEGETGLMADRLASAIAEGRLEEFLTAEIPDNDYARQLVSMMMGMTGMLPAETVRSSHEDKKERVRAGDMPQAEEAGPAEVPGPVKDAVVSGDVAGLMDMLKKEHEKRAGPAGRSGSGGVDRDAAAPARSEPAPAIEKGVVDGLIGIADENDVGLDWIILRALKLYVRDYRDRGRL